MRGLADRVFVVSGAASGIGRATVQRLAEEGAKAISLDIDDADTGHGVRTFRCDVADEQSVATAFARTLDAVGPVSGIVSNAAVYYRSEEAPAHALDLATWEKTLAVNLTGAFLFCKHGIRAIRRSRPPGGGRVVCVGSPNGQFGCNPGTSPIRSARQGSTGWPG